MDAFISRKPDGFMISHPDISAHLNNNGEITYLEVYGMHNLTRELPMFKNGQGENYFTSTRTTSVLFSYNIEGLSISRVYSTGTHPITMDVYIAAISESHPPVYQLTSYIALPHPEDDYFIGIGKNTLRTTPIRDTTNTISLCREDLKKCIIMQFTPCTVTATPTQQQYVCLTMEWELPPKSGHIKWITLTLSVT